MTDTAIGIATTAIVGDTILTDDEAKLTAAAVLDALEEHGWSVFPLRDESRPENVRADERARIRTELLALFDRTYGPPLLADVLAIIDGEDSDD